METWSLADGRDKTTSGWVFWGRNQRFLQRQEETSFRLIASLPFVCSGINKELQCQENKIENNSLFIAFRRTLSGSGHAGSRERLLAPEADLSSQRGGNGEDGNGGWPNREGLGL